MAIYWYIFYFGLTSTTWRIRGYSVGVGSVPDVNFVLENEYKLYNTPVPEGYVIFSIPSSGASVTHGVGVSIAVIMTWGLWKSLASALLYIDISVCPSSEVLFFFGHLLSRFNHLEAPVRRQATPSVGSSPIDMSDALESLLELND